MARRLALSEYHIRQATAAWVERGAHATKRMMVAERPLVNYRVNRDLPTVVTSNWTEREATFYHGRIASRLKAAALIHIATPDACGKISSEV